MDWLDKTKSVLIGKAYELGGSQLAQQAEIENLQKIWSRVYNECYPRSMSDPYIDPQSGVLRNRFGLADQKSLDLAEANSVSVRSILLQLNPLKGNFDSEHLKAIHAYLFRDV